MHTRADSFRPVLIFGGQVSHCRYLVNFVASAGPGCEDIADGDCVLRTVFDFDAGIRPGWQVLAAGLVVVMIDFIRARWPARAPRVRTAAAE